jgi:hypothetical protein
MNNCEDCKATKRQVSTLSYQDQGKNDTFAQIMHTNISNVYQSIMEIKCGIYM